MPITGLPRPVEILDGVTVDVKRILAIDKFADHIEIHFLENGKPIRRAYNDYETTQKKYEGACAKWKSALEDVL